MQRSSIAEKVVLAAVLVPLAVCAFQGPHDAIHTFPRDRTTGQYAVSALQALYGVGALLSLVGVPLRNRWAIATLLLWSVAITLAAALATMAWGGSGWRVAIQGGGLVAVVSGLIAWGGIAHVRRAAPHADAGAGRP